VAYRKGGILITEFYDNRIITAKECEQLVQLVSTNFPNEKLPILITAGRNTYFDPSARAYSASDVGTKHSLAEAYVVDGFVHHFIGWMYLLFNRPKVRTKLFLKKDKAIEWLQGVSTN
jgi:hypothetical protein